MNAPQPALPFPVWDEARAGRLDEPGRLLYRSNLLGSDLRITNYGGGNTSAKIVQKDLLTGTASTVLWVKGSGGDLGSMTLDGFSTLYMDKLNALKGLYRGLAHEDEMVAYLPHCTFNLNPRAASIDTPLHAYLPFAHVDHMHPDAVIAIAAMADGETSRSKCSKARWAGCPGCGRVMNSGCGWPSMWPNIRASVAGCWAAMACSPGATTPRAATKTPSA